METRKVRTTADLVKYASQYGAPQTEQRLRVLEAEGIPVELAFDAVRVELRIQEHRRNSALVAGCRGKKVGLVLPVPHHIVDLFMPVAQVALLQPGEHALHGPVQDHEGRIIKGARACRAAAAGMEVMVFEAFREGGALFVDASVADLLEPRLLPAGIRLMAHLRPHRNPQDIAFTPGGEVAFV